MGYDCKPFDLMSKIILTLGFDEIILTLAFDHVWMVDMSLEKVFSPLNQKGKILSNVVSWSCQLYMCGPPFDDPNGQPNWLGGL